MMIARLMNFRHRLLAASLGGVGLMAAQSATPIADRAYDYVNGLISNLRTSYFIFETADSGFNHGIPSGLFASDNSLITPDAIDGSCVFDAKSADACSTAVNIYDKGQSFLRLKIPPLLLKSATGTVQYFGLNFEEPEDYGVNRVGGGVDLRGATAVTLEFVGKASDPASGCKIKFAIRGSETDYIDLPTQPAEFTFAFDSLYPPLRRLTGVHTMFSIATDAVHCGGGGAVLARKIRLTPPPDPVKKFALGFPVANRTFGVRPLLMPCKELDAKDIPADQTLKNPAPIYESSLVLMGLLSRSDLTSRTNARLVADAFVYALNHPNSALGLPSRPSRIFPDPTSLDEAILNNSYRSGQIGFDDPQPLATKLPGGPNQGEMALSGFSATKAPTKPDSDLGNFCLVLDGATGGNNAFAMLALVAASRAFESGSDEEYLMSARRIAQWIINNLWTNEIPNSKKTSGFDNYGGFYIGWNDGGVRAPNGFLYGKSVENNADIYTAMKVLSDREVETGDTHNLADRWTKAALHAGEYVGRMRIKAPASSDPQVPAGIDHFYGGTLPCTQKLNPGLLPETYCPEYDTTWVRYDPNMDPSVDPSTRQKDPTLVPEVVNLYDYLDATTFVALALAGSDDYGTAFSADPMDWSQPMMWSLKRNAVPNVMSYGRISNGFDLVTPNEDYSATVDMLRQKGAPLERPVVAYGPGITWEFTGQAVVTMIVLNALDPKQPFTAEIAKYLEEIRKTQDLDHFAEAGGLPAATLNPVTDPSKQEPGSNMPGPYFSCLPTPFQCFGSRVGLAATMWAAFAETGFNPLARPRPKAESPNSLHRLRPK